MICRVRRDPGLAILMAAPILRTCSASVRVPPRRIVTKRGSRTFGRILKVRVRIGAIEITLPCPLDEPWRELAVNPGNDLTAAHPDSNWVFRGYSPGRHIDASHLRNRLRHVFSTRAARLGTLHELTKLAPVAILLAVDKRIGGPRA